MALIIKRPMPHKCDWCFYRGHCEVRMKHIHDTFGKYDSFTDPYREQRLPNCPLVEIPDEYGRLIDAGELEKAAEKMVVCDSYEYTIAHEMVKKLLKIAPTVLEASKETG